MLRIALILYSIVATTFAGTAVIAVLTTGLTGTMPIVVAAVAGAVLAAPASYILAGKITG
ncbi:CTP synthetase [Roseobacter denitrificans]|uniref:CTP synthetase n=1 Tax=Roseobacter denitrificans (strain ATCC 33942 / OCh 114) TaxID=375451 RepID=Q16BA1_ROSDO|nr:hypothetical protein [Roseobacter denitrificans]ABG30742.1 hypothetical protein RD1_1083 [Roseobacter denitrificans OCh 114]AVL53859.1 CTP synthetase [Roseobacter denitrificans]SFG17561.1 hypothetical protein SAMN05443635_10930 [Roseobacter denitrificans OCh 114]